MHERPTSTMAELSPYEQERERTIARNREMLASLNIPTPTVNDRVSRPHQPYPLFTGRINPDSAAFNLGSWSIRPRMGLCMRRGTVGARRGSVQARRSKGHFPFYRGSVDAGCRVANLGGSFYTDLFHATTQPICTLVRSQGVALIAVDGKSTPRCQLHRARTPTLSCMQTASCAPVRGSFRRCVFNVPANPRVWDDRLGWRRRSCVYGPCQGWGVSVHVLDGYPTARALLAAPHSSACD